MNDSQSTPPDRYAGLRKDQIPSAIWINVHVYAVVLTVTLGLLGAASRGFDGQINAGLLAAYAVLAFGVGAQFLRPGPITARILPGAVATMYLGSVAYALITMYMPDASTPWFVVIAVMLFCVGAGVFLDTVSSVLDFVILFVGGFIFEDVTGLGPVAAGVYLLVSLVLARSLGLAKSSLPFRSLGSSIDLSILGPYSGITAAAIVGRDEIDLSLEPATITIAVLVVATIAFRLVRLGELSKTGLTCFLAGTSAALLINIAPPG
jgi:hypothetical protein